MTSRPAGGLGGLFPPPSSRDPVARSGTAFASGNSGMARATLAARFLCPFWPRTPCASPARVAAGAVLRRFLAAAAPARRLDLRGIYPPLVTPFTSQGRVDYARLQENLRLYAEIPFRGNVWTLEGRRTRGGRREPPGAICHSALLYLAKFCGICYLSSFCG